VPAPHLDPAISAGDESGGRRQSSPEAPPHSAADTVCCMTSQEFGDRNHVMPVGIFEKLTVRLVFAQRLPVLGRFARQLLKFLGTDLPASTLQPGTGLMLPHGSKVVVHSSSRIGRNVTLMQFVTIGRSDIWKRQADGFEGVIIQDGVIVGAGAAVLAKDKPLVLGQGCIVGANSVVTKSVPPGEIWAGAPATFVGTRREGNGG
jgi:serine O-acetyltransferase